MIGIYVRVSTEEQAKHGYSIKDQLDKCRDKAGSEEVMEYVDDGVSGEFLDRPALNRLREDVRNGLLEKVICYDPDRLSRKLMNQLIITEEIEKRAELIFVNGEYAKTPEGMLFYQMRGAIAEFEKAKITERLSSGRIRKAKEGKIIKDPKIYGYIYNKETSQLEINEEEAKVVRLVFELFTRPNGRVQGMNGIAKFLTDQGIPTKKGKDVWHRQVIRQMLMNEAYIGRFYHNRWNTEGNIQQKNKRLPAGEKLPMKERPREEWIELECPAIIDEMTFFYAQKLLNESRRRWTKKGRREYLLSGLLRCGECGNTMTGVYTKNWGKYDRMYTDRKNTAGAKHPGCGLRVKADEIETNVWEYIRNYLYNPSQIAAASESLMENDTSYETEEMERIQKEIEKLKAGRKRLLNLISTGVDISETEIRESLKENKMREKELTEKLRELEETKQHTSLSQYSFQLYQEAADFLTSKGEENLSFADKQDLIRMLVREIIVFNDNVEIKTF
ncbi:recombinase family protein [Fervidibacillus albus]|uniref:Recombinase family protein n=1 Tax=Fervidibacillus albus TaxID=2980026 RepID=A0A9E8LVA2_9BACI|nr:recombinase family protein [Fervidibacillus albus]WAA10345.1 recombinase family protein [Fervidibacillus albus]